MQKEVYTVQLTEKSVRYLITSALLISPPDFLNDERSKTFILLQRN